MRVALCGHALALPMPPKKQKTSDCTAAAWVEVFEKYRNKSPSPNSETDAAFCRHFLHLPYLGASELPLIASVLPPVERAFCDLLPKPTPMYADVLQVLLHIRKHRGSWLNERQKKSKYYHAELTKDMGV